MSNLNNQLSTGQQEGDADGGIWNWAVFTGGVFAGFMLGLASNWIWSAWIKEKQDKNFWNKFLRMKHMERELRKKQKEAHGAQEEAEQFQRKAQELLKNMLPWLKMRQIVMCEENRRYSVPQCEKNLLDIVARDRVAEQLSLKKDLRDLFQTETSCITVENKDFKTKMPLTRLYLRYWQQQIMLQKHRKVAEALKGLLSTDK